MPKIKLKIFVFSAILFVLLSASFLFLTHHFGRAAQLSYLLFIVLMLLALLRAFISHKPDNISFAPKLNLAYFLTAILILFFIFHSFLFSNFINSAHDLSYIFPPVLKSFSLVPQTWESFWGGGDLGHSQFNGLWSEPIRITYSLLGRTGLDFNFIVKSTLVLQLLLGTYGIFSLLSLFRSSNLSKLLASIFYLANTYFLTLIDGGQIFLSFAYALFPLCLYYFFQSKLPLAALSLLIGSYFDIRILPLFVLVTFFQPKKLLFLFTVISFGHAFWLLPAILSHTSPSFSYASSSQLSLFSFIFPAHLLFFSQPHWYNNLFGDIQPPAWYLFFIPTAAFFSLIFSKNNLKFASFLLLSGLFLSKGLQPPFGQFYSWAYTHIPGFAIFRDPSKFTLLVSLGYTFLLASLPSKLKWAILPLVILSVFPAFTGRMTGTFSTDPNQAQYFQLARFFQSQPGDFRILWIPTKHPLGFADSHKIWTEAISLLAKQPFLATVNGSYELLNYLRSPAAPQLLDIISVKYIAYPIPDERKKPLKPDEREYYYWFRDWFKSQPWLKEVFSSPTLAIYENVHYSPRFYQVKNFTQIVGGDNTYDRFNLRDTIVSHTHPPQRLANHVVLNNTSKLDFSLAFLSPKQLLSPASHIRPDGTDPSGWWSRQTGDYIFIKNYLFDKHKVAFSDSDLGLGYALAEGEKTLEIFALAREGDLYARILVSSSSGSLKFTLPQSTVTIPTLSSGNSFNWFKIASITPSDKIKVTSTGSINILNALAIISASQNLAENIPSAITVSPSSLPEVQYHPISQTKYKITIPTSNTWLVFSESYDPRWVLSNGQNTYPSQIAYDMLNSFYIHEPGEYTLEYSPQKYVPLGVAISSATLLILLVGIIYAKRRV